MVSTSKRSTTPSEDVISERHLRKRLAARVRQQRCRARKREAKLAKAQREVQVKAPRPSILHHHHHHQIVRGPVLIRSPPRMSMPLLHHPTSPFIMYPRRAPPAFPPSGPPPPPSAASPPTTLWHHQQPRSPPITARPIITGIPYPSRPLHQEIMAGAGSALALGICPSPPTTNSNHHQHHHPRHHINVVRSPPSPNLQRSIPRVSPVAECCNSNSNNKNNKTVLLMPELDHHLERSEETAIDAMLSLGRTPSKMAAV